MVPLRTALPRGPPLPCAGPQPLAVDPRTTTFRDTADNPRDEVKRMIRIVVFVFDYETLHE